jgi:hypothetical protein
VKRVRNEIERTFEREERKEGGNNEEEMPGFSIKVGSKIEEPT